MEKTVDLLSLLYELSLTNTKHQSPEDTARKFIKKFLARKSLQYGAAWQIKAVTQDRITFSRIYSMPDLPHEVEVSRSQFSRHFNGEVLCETKTSLTGSKLKGKFIYFKLADFGLLEFFDANSSQTFTKEAFYPFIDVINQFATNLSSSYAFKSLEEEINLRQAYQKSLKTNEEKYRRIIDNIQLGLMEVDNEEVIQHVNKPFLDLTGYEEGELLGRVASEVFISEEDKKSKEFMASQNEERKSGKSGSYEMMLRSKSGEMKWAIISGAPNYNQKGELIGSIGIHLDITEEKKLREEIEFRSAQLEKLFEKSLDALISIDSKGRIFEWSPQAEEIFGYSREEIRGQKLSETIIPHNFREAHDKGMDNYHKTGHGPVLNNRIEISALNKDGEEFPIELTIFPLQFRDEMYFTAFVRDITEIKRSKENMEKALERQKELNQMKSQFISMTSHELRTPLTTIKTNTELINYQLNAGKELDMDRLAKNVSRIDNNVDRLNHLISNILNIGRLDAEKVNLEPEPMVADEFIKNHILPDYHQRGHGIICFVKGQEYSSMLDKRLFTHILTNLIDNAIKYSPESKEPEVHVNYEPGSLGLVVKDYGIGIPEKDQKRLFDKFYRASNVGNIQGTGLGLSIVSEYVKLHGGQINVESEVGNGTSFIINFPTE